MYSGQNRRETFFICVLYLKYGWCLSVMYLTGGWGSTLDKIGFPHSIPNIWVIFKWVSTTNIIHANKAQELGDKGVVKFTWKVHNRCIYAGRSCLLPHYNAPTNIKLYISDIFNYMQNNFGALLLVKMQKIDLYFSCIRQIKC